MAAPDTDKDIPVLLKKAKKQKQYFALVTGGDEDKLIVSKKPVKSSVVKDLKKKVKGKKTVIGECKGGDKGTTVFYTEDGFPSNAEKIVMRIASKAGVKVKAEFKAGSAPG